VYKRQTQPAVENEIKKEQLNEEIAELSIAMEKIKQQLNEKKRELYSIKYKKIEDCIKEKRKFIRKCPKDNCKGFLSTALKCEICGYYSCKDCRELKGKTEEEKNNHVCDKSILESVKLLEKDSKECPKCSAMIFKIDGCFATNTPILMYNGSIKMAQDIQEGDVLVGDDGKSRTVLSTTNGEDYMYEIEQNNGLNYIVNSKHSLVLKYPEDKIIKWDENNEVWKIKWFCNEESVIKTKDFYINNFIDKDLSKKESRIQAKIKARVKAEEFKKKLGESKSIEMRVDEYIKLNKSIKKCLSGYKSECGINYEYIEVDIEPYMLGIWLANETCINSLIQDINNKIEKYKLLENKHIPIKYIKNSRDIRLKVLAGIIDVRGYLPIEQKGKKVIIKEKNIQLVKDIEMLATSLGFIVNISFIQSDNEMYYKITITGEKLNEIPTILPSKKCVATLTNNRTRYTKININPIGKGKYFGWAVDGNKRFVSPDYTVYRNCHQMFCTECHTAFDWRTLKIETENIHNPHYFEYQRKINNGVVPRNPNDIQCEREFNYNFVRANIRINYNWDLLEICRTILDIRHEKLGMFTTDNIITRNLESRIKYMRNIIDENKFKNLLEKRYREETKKREIRNMLNMYITCMIDIIYRFIESPDLIQEDQYKRRYEISLMLVPNTQNIIKDNYEMENLREYTNECLENVGRMYNSKIYFIDLDYMLH
jgi:hypothetical protein